MPGSGRGAEKGLVGSKTNQGRVNRMGRAVGRDLPVEVDGGGRLTSGKTCYMEESLSWGGGGSTLEWALGGQDLGRGECRGGIESGEQKRLQKVGSTAGTGDRPERSVLDGITGVMGCEEVGRLCEVSRMGGSYHPAWRNGDRSHGETECRVCRNVRDERGVG